MAAPGTNVCFFPTENSFSQDKSTMYSQNSPLLFQVLSEPIYITVSDTDSKTDLQMGMAVCPSDEKDNRGKALRP